MNTFEALSAARDAIVAGWTKGAYKTVSFSASSKQVPQFCAIGSIQHALSVHCGGLAGETNKKTGGRFGTALKYLTHAMASLGFIRFPAVSLSGKFNQIISFNDHEQRTKDQVLAAFNKAVSNAKRRHLNG